MRSPGALRVKVKSALCRATFVAGFGVIFANVIMGWGNVAHSVEMSIGLFLGTLAYQAIKAYRKKK